MIALVGLKSPSANTVGMEFLPALPAPPAARYAGSIVSCDNERAVRETLAWFRGIHAVRPTFVLGLVARPQVCAVALGSFTLPVTPILSPDELADGHLPEDVVRAIRGRSIEGLILEEAAIDYGPELMRERRTLECMVAHAIRGGTANRVARDLDISRTTLWRRLAPLGIKAKPLMAWARLRAFELRIEHGVSPEAAMRAGGWGNRRAYEKSIARERQKFDAFRDRTDPNTE